MMTKKGTGGFTLVEIMIVVAIISVISAVAMPNFIKARKDAQRQTCIANLKRIEDAKIFWALDGGTGEPEMDDIVPDYIKKEPVCASGGEYTIGDMNTEATCSLAGEPWLHVLPIT